MASPKALLPLLVAALSLFPLCFQAEATEYDSFVLTLYYPGTLCRTSVKPHCCFENQCCRFDSPAEFAIHEFRPDYTEGSDPTCCSNTPLVESKISPLIPALVEYWPNLYCGEYTLCDGEKGNKWAYEWGKYGTCAAPILGDAYSYFLKALNLYTENNISSILRNSGHEPSNDVTYPLTSIVNSIEKGVGATPTVHCKEDSLYQVRLCFNKDFTPRDCASSNSCPSNIILPKLRSGGVTPCNAEITRMVNRKIFKPLTVA